MYFNDSARTCICIRVRQVVWPPRAVTHQAERLNLHIMHVAQNDGRNDTHVYRMCFVYAYGLFDVTEKSRCPTTTLIRLKRKQFFLENHTYFFFKLLGLLVYKNNLL